MYATTLQDSLNALSGELKNHRQLPEATVEITQFKKCNGEVLRKNKSGLCSVDARQCRLSLQYSPGQGRLGAAVTNSEQKTRTRATGKRLLYRDPHLSRLSGPA